MPLAFFFGLSAPDTEVQTFPIFSFSIAADAQQTRNKKGPGFRKNRAAFKNYFTVVLPAPLRKIPPSYRPVSYTHLDVYKRQSLAFCR